MNQPTLKKLTAFNQIYKEMDILYHNYAKKVGLSDAAFWILYSLSERTENTPFTQRDLCNLWFFAPQTINSALKDLQKRDIIFLEAVPGNKKNKWVKLTEAGHTLALKTVLPLIKSECESFEALSSEECDLMLSLTQKYISILSNKIKDMTS